MADKAEITAAMLKALVSDFHGMTRSKLAASAKHPSHQAASAKQQTGRVGLREWLTEGDPDRRPCPSHQAVSAQQQTGRVGLREWLTEGPCRRRPYPSHQAVPAQQQTGRVGLRYLVVSPKEKMSLIKEANFSWPSAHSAHWRVPCEEFHFPPVLGPFGCVCARSCLLYLRFLIMLSFLLRADAVRLCMYNHCVAVSARFSSSSALCLGSSGVFFFNPPPVGGMFLWLVRS